MKVQNLLLLVLLVAQPFFTYAQEPKVKVRVKMSRDEETDGRRIPVRMTPMGDDQFLVYMAAQIAGVNGVKLLKPKLALYSMDKLKVLDTEELKPYDERMETTTYFENKNWLIATRDHENGAAILYREVEYGLKNKGEAFKELCVISGREIGRKPSTFSYKWGNNYGTEISSDSTRLLIASPEFRDAKSGMAIIKMAVVGKGMELLWSNILVLEKKAKRTDIIKVIVTNDGTVYLLIEEEHGGSKIKGGEVNFSISLYRVDANSATRSELIFENDEYPQSAMMSSGPKGDIFIAGTYSKVKGRHNVQMIGTFGAKVEQGTGDLGPVKTYVFPKNEYTEKQKGEVEMHTKSLLVRSDGGAYIISNRIWSSGNEYPILHNDLGIILSVDSDGNMEWQTKFDRRISAPTRLAGNMLPAIFNDQLFIFLIDDPEQKAKRKQGLGRYTKRTFKAKDAFSAYLKFSNDGKYRERTVLKTEKNSYIIQGFELEPMGKGRFLALGTEKVKRYKFYPVKIEFSLEEL